MNRELISPGWGADLLPCPFCGGKAEIVLAEEAGESAFVAQCMTLNCSASSKVIYAIKEDVRELLVEAWNRRALSSATPSGEAVDEETAPVSSC